MYIAKHLLAWLVDSNSGAQRVLFDAPSQHSEADARLHLDLHACCTTPMQGLQRAAPPPMLRAMLRTMLMHAMRKAGCPLALSMQSTARLPVRLSRG